jgi:hypothetical protein
MENKRVIQLVSGMDAPDREATGKFYQWLEEVHCPHLFKYEGIKRYLNCIRLPVAEPFQPSVTDYPEYVSINEFKNKEAMNSFPNSPEFQSAIKDGLETWGDTIGRKKVWLVAYEETKSFERKLERNVNRVIQIVGAVSPSNSQTAERYYKWLDNEHCYHIFEEYKCIARATNYRRMETELPFDPVVKDYPYYITIFEINSRRDCENIVSSIKGRPPVSEEWGTEIGYKKIWQVTYEIVKYWER